ncbi:MAG: hypothetical protein BMS9Abin02_0261 [Anaerolineae bacterium]|nr:MAG: hypothetical protein BMS9Abin02_0261 [Anaerolineae bacterium]
MTRDDNIPRVGTKAVRYLSYRGRPLAILAILGLLLILIISLFLSGQKLDTVHAQEAPDPRFGIVEAFWAQEEAVELNVGWERILFYWREIQPTGPEDWNTLHVLEEWLAQANSNGRTVVGLIKNTPPWASEDGTEAGLPKGLYLDIDDPENLWSNFVRKLADYYSVRNVHHWIIWNEPDIPEGVYGYEFAGTTRDYYRMLKVAYQVIKDADPDAVIHLAGLTWWHNQEYLDQLLQIAVDDEDAEANDFFFDVISLHLYFRSETIKTVIEEVNRIQERHGLNKPIWINETNAPPNQDPEWPVERPQFDVDLDQQSWFISQALALGFAAGAERISLYKLLDIHLEPGGESFGLLRPDYSRRPAFLAYDTAINILSGFTKVFRQQAADYFVITFLQPSKVTRVIWARTPSPVNISVPAIAESAHLIDVYGEEIVISADNGVYRLNLEAAKCPKGCIIGGPPLYLVESIEPNQQPAIPTASTIEGETVTPLIATITPSRTPTPTRTPRPTKTNTLTSTPTNTLSFSPTNTRVLSSEPTSALSTIESSQNNAEQGLKTPSSTQFAIDPTGEFLFEEGSEIEQRGNSGVAPGSESRNFSTILLLLFIFSFIVILAVLIRRLLH